MLNTEERRLPLMLANLNLLAWFMYWNGCGVLCCDGNEFKDGNTGFNGGTLRVNGDDDDSLGSID